MGFHQRSQALVVFLSLMLLLCLASARQLMNNDHQLAGNNHADAASSEKMKKKIDVNEAKVAKKKVDFGGDVMHPDQVPTPSIPGIPGFPYPWPVPVPIPTNPVPIPIPTFPLPPIPTFPIPPVPVVPGIAPPPPM